MFGVVIPSRNIENVQVCSSVRINELHLPAANIIIVDDDESGEIPAFCKAGGMIRVRAKSPSSSPEMPISA